MSSGICARGYKFQLRLASDDISVTPLVQEVEIAIDLPDHIASESRITAPESGMDIIFANSFLDAPAIAITAHNLNTGDYWTVSDVTETGFRLQFRNAGGSGVTRLFDYVAKGVGSAS